MKREELRNKLTDILSAAMSGGINFTQAERSIWDLFNPGLPPAEGAEEIRVEYSEESLGFFRSFIRARKELCAISPTETYSLEEAIRKAFDEFATLHAQQMADKMVEEKLREELIAYDKYIGAKGWIDNYKDETAEPTVDEYLKSREK